MTGTTETPPEFGGECVRRAAAGIDLLNDAGAIFAWPGATGSPRVLHVNAGFELLLGFTPAQAIGAATDLLHGPLTDLGRVEFMHGRLRDAHHARMPLIYYRRDGVPIWVEVSVRGVPPTDAADGFCVATLRDVTPRKEFEFALAKEKRKLQVTLAVLGDAVITTVADGRVDYINLAAQKLLGVDPAEAYGAPIGDVVQLHDAGGETIDVLNGAGGPDDAYRAQAEFGRNGDRKHLAFVSSAIADEGYVVVLRDITAQHRLSRRLSYEASHDALTGIYNRRKFEQVLEVTLAAPLVPRAPHALAFVDLDRFKAINDNCGHAVGDRVLIDIARLLQAHLRERDTVARIGGDEFAVLLNDCSLENARRVFENIRLAVETYRVRHGDREFDIGASIGLTAIDGSLTDAADLLAQADAACYAAKAAGRNAVAG